MTFSSPWLHTDSFDVVVYAEGGDHGMLCSLGLGDRAQPVDESDPVKRQEPEVDAA